MMYFMHEMPFNPETWHASYSFIAVFAIYLDLDKNIIERQSSIPFTRETYLWRWTMWNDKKSCKTEFFTSSTGRIFQ